MTFDIIDRAQFAALSRITCWGNVVTIPERSSRSCHSKLVRIDRSQAVLIPAEFELPGDRVCIRREGSKLIIEPMARIEDIVELLAQWKKEEPLPLEDQFPNILDMPATPEHFL